MPKNKHIKISSTAFKKSKHEELEKKPYSHVVVKDIKDIKKIYDVISLVYHGFGASRGNGG